MSFLSNKNLEQADKEVFLSCENELVRQSEHLEMIASENFTSVAVMQAMGSIFTNKYAEGYPYKRYYSGCENVDTIEALAIKRVCKIFNAKFANVQPHSGSSANSAVYLATLQAGDKILGMDLSQGGHLTHGSKVSYSGKNYSSFFYGVDENGLIDYDEVEKIAKLVMPKIIICGASAYSRIIDFKKFGDIAKSVGALLFADIAHIAGLVAGGVHPSPFPYADIVTTTTHKTLRGPRGGVILCNDEALAKKINSAIFPGFQGGPLGHIIAAKAVSFKEILDDSWSDYAKQIISNTAILAKTLQKRGYKLVSGGSDNHLILMTFLNLEFSGKDAEEALQNAGITVNKNTVPGENRSPFITSGIRLGSPALTSRGMKEGEFEYIANKIADVLDDISNTSLQEKVKADVKQLTSKFVIYTQSTY